MGVDYYPCVICGNIGNDCGFMESCANCEGDIFECCYDEQKKKYGLVQDKEKAKHSGETSLKECDDCSKETLTKRIADKKKELKELELELNK